MEAYTAQTNTDIAGFFGRIAVLGNGDILHVSFLCF